MIQRVTQGGHVAEERLKQGLFPPLQAHKHTCTHVIGTHRSGAQGSPRCGQLRCKTLSARCCEKSRGRVCSTLRLGGTCCGDRSKGGDAAQTGGTMGGRKGAIDRAGGK
eukprot:scaffold63187_cov18-Tisochrysis_lutea.AAC.1